MLENIAQEEQKFIFNSFNANVAYKIGQVLSKKAIQQKLPIVIDISTAKQTLYHFAAFGSSANNENFIRRKRNTVFLFGHSTKWVAAKVKGDANAMHQRYATTDQDYSILEGGFPIFVKNMGLVAVACISGLTEQEDHALVVEALKAITGVE
ncbi:MAG: heme-binding protein [Erysipelotrichaceae bacterium]